MVHAIVWGHRAPTNYAGRSCRCECNDRFCRDRGSSGSVGQVLATDAEHDDEDDHIWDPCCTFPQVDDTVAAEGYLEMCPAQLFTLLTLRIVRYIPLGRLS